jgi:predicted RNase H-like nuclease (RuvC/YqgF family)
MTDLYLHVHLVSDAAQAEIRALTDRITALEAQGGHLMARQEQLDALLGRLDAATNEIASDLTRLRDEIRTGTVSEASVSHLDEMIARLEALGRDPEDPVPGDEGANIVWGTDQQA